MACHYLVISGGWLRIVIPRWDNTHDTQSRENCHKCIFCQI